MSARRLLEELLSEVNAPDEAKLKLAQVVTEITQGPYPPPKMLADYKAIDPKIVDHILSSAETQRAHRIKLEVLTTEGAESRQRFANISQTIIATLGLLVAGGVYVVPMLYSAGWVVPVAIVAISVGGRPVATVMTRWLAAKVNDKP